MYKDQEDIKIEINMKELYLFKQKIGNKFQKKE